MQHSLIRSVLIQAVAAVQVLRLVKHVVDIARNVLEAEDRHPVVVLVIKNVLKGGVRHGKQSA